MPDTPLPPKRYYQYAIVKPHPTDRIHRKVHINPHQRGVIPIQYTIQTASRYRPVWQGPALSLSSVETVLRWSIHQERSQVALRWRAAPPPTQGISNYRGT